jgi:hypothetical protein
MLCFALSNPDVYCAAGIINAADQLHSINPLGLPILIFDIDLLEYWLIDEGYLV